jgi:hypothetical protein
LSSLRLLADRSRLLRLPMNLSRSSCKPLRLGPGWHPREETSRNGHPWLVNPIARAGVWERHRWAEPGPWVNAGGGGRVLVWITWADLSRSGSGGANLQWLSTLRCFLCELALLDSDILTPPKFRPSLRKITLCLVSKSVPPFRPVAPILQSSLPLLGWPSTHRRAAR